MESGSANRCGPSRPYLARIAGYEPSIAKTPSVDDRIEDRPLAALGDPPNRVFRETVGPHRTSVK
jgi:hypothetical protein